MATELSHDNRVLKNLTKKALAPTDIWDVVDYKVGKEAEVIT